MNLLEEIIVYILTIIFIKVLDNPKQNTLIELVMYQILAQLFYVLILKKIYVNFFPKDLTFDKVLVLAKQWPDKIKQLFL